MNINRKQKALIEIYLAIFIVLGITMQWNNISWIFNYDAVSGLAYDFMYPYPESHFFEGTQAVTASTQNPSPIVSAQIPVVEQITIDNALEIPAIALKTPLIIASSTDKNILTNQLDKGVVYYPGSVLPGQNGQMIILGHSAPPNWPRIKHDWVFSDLENLKPGDKVTLSFNNKVYTYSVTGKTIIQRGADITLDGTEKTNNVLVLVSCWPPGKDYKRIAVQAVLQR